MNPQLVPIYIVDAVFPKVVAYLKRGIEEGGPSNLTVPWLWSQCGNGNCRLVVDNIDHPTLAAVMRFSQWRDGPVTEVLVMGGVGNGKTNWPELVEWIREFGRINGMAQTVFNGRKGLERLLGARPLYTTFAIDN